MNWDRGLRRITLVVSIVVGIVGAGIFYYDAARVLRHNERILANERRDEFSEFAGTLLIDEWKRAKTWDEQDLLWSTWTGELLPREPWWEDESRLRPDVPDEPMTLEEMARTRRVQHVRLSPTAEELPRLKEQGWQTAKGDPLPLTPMGVWYVKRDLSIKDLEETVIWNTIELSIGMVFGAGLGFGVVWIGYGISKWGAWPLLVWISRGFREAK